MKKLEEDEDMEGEAEEDAEEDDEEDADDERLYCFCQKRSYGDVRSSSLGNAVADILPIDDRMRQ